MVKKSFTALFLGGLLKNSGTENKEKTPQIGGVFSYVCLQLTLLSERSDRALAPQTYLEYIKDSPKSNYTWDKRALTRHFRGVCAIFVE